MATRMHGVPFGLDLLLSTLSGSVDTKALYEDIPRRLEAFNEKRLTKRYPDVVADEIPA